MSASTTLRSLASPAWLRKALALASVLFLVACVPGGNEKPNEDGDGCKEEEDHHGNGHDKNSGNPGHDKDDDEDDDHKSKGKKKCGNTSTTTSTSTSTTTTTTTTTSTTTAVYTFPDLPGRVCTVDNFQQGSGEQVIKKVDILFVMDHSGSMKDDWERVAINVQSLVRELPADTNVRYAVLLADVGAWKGKLYAPAGFTPVLDNQKLSVKQISDLLFKMFNSGMTVSDAGTGEAGFYSLYHATTTGAAANQKLGFFRPDAALSVIFMSDEQDLGFPFPAVQAPGLPPRCDASTEDKIKKDYYDKSGISLDVTFNAVKKLKGDMPVKTHAFINITKEDLFTYNDKNAKCLYDSLGYGYYEMVDKTKGVLFSIKADKAEGLARCGRVIKDSLGIQHEFALSKTADKVDPATILSTVDNTLVKHDYRVASNSVFLENAGVANSKIAVRHCEPDGRVNWNITAFAGTPAQTSVGLSWVTAEYATAGKILFGTNANNLNGEVAGNSGTNHSVTVSGLTPNTVYFFKAVSWDEFGQVKTSNEVLSFRTLPDWSIAGFTGQAARTSASLQWATSEYATKGKVFYGTDPGALGAQTAETAVSTGHNVSISGLSPDTVYYFQAMSSDEFGLEKHSGVISIRTQADWGIIGFAGRPTRTTVNLSWSTPDQVATGKVLYGTSAGNLAQQVAHVGAGTAHSVTLTGLTPSTDYFFKAVSQDGQGGEKVSNVILVRTVDDWSVTGFAGQSTQSAVAVTWTTPGYSTSGRVFWGASDSSLTNVVTDSIQGSSHGATISGLNPDTLYYVQASSIDGEGVEKRSGVVAIRTQQIPLPEWSISNFAGTSTLNSATLTWNTPQYATTRKVLWGDSLTSVGTEVIGAGSGTSHSVTVNGLQPDKLYYFVAVSGDDRGQEKSSDVIAIRTMKDDVVVPPSNWVITGFDGTTTPNQANLIWQTPGAQSTATIKVGLTADDLTYMTVNVTTAQETHIVGVPGLDANTQYFFQVIASDSAGRTVESVIIAKKTKN